MQITYNNKQVATKHLSFLIVNMGHHSHSSIFRTNEERVQWVQNSCKENGMRNTPALRGVIEELIEKDQPTSLAQLADSTNIKGLCDQATIYRLLIKLEEKGIIRKIGLHDRSTYYVLSYPGEHGDYLVCKSCGALEKLDMSCPVEKLEKSIEKKSGFSNLFHELEFYGICPSCQ